MAKAKRCKGVKSDGSKCTANAMENGYCYYHQSQAKSPVDTGKKPAKPEAKKSKRARFEFRKTDCPRCGSSQTKATSTQGDVQYRICLMAVCRKRYSVKGTLVK